MSKSSNIHTERSAADRRETSPRPASGGHGILGGVWEWTKSLAIAIGIAMLIRWPVAEPFKIPSGSMRPTFLEGDRIFVNKHAYGVRYPFNGFRVPFTRTTLWYSDGWLWEGPMPDRWDIVVFKSVEANAEHDTLVKRVVGLPGEQVLIRDGRLYINGTPIELPASMPDVYYSTPRVGPSRHESNGYGLIPDEEHSLVPPGHVFLLGDNSDHSRDGRWFGFVPHHHLLGEVSAIWFPVGRWRDFTGFSRSWWWIGGWTLFAAYIVARLFWGRSVTVHSEGLAGRVSRGEKILIRFAFGVPVPLLRARVGRGRTLERGDIVLYRPPRDADAPDLLLGVVAGLPKEKVQILNSELRVNGKAVEDISLPSLALDGENGREGKYGVARGREFTNVPEDHFFVLADGSDAGPDSRVFGWVPRDRVVGLAQAVWWPPTRMRSVSSKGDTAPG